MLLNIFLLISIFLCASCGGSKAPSYDESQSESLRQASALLREQRYGEALARLQGQGAGEYNSLRELLLDQQNELELIGQANELLLKGSYGELSALVEKAERRGEASPELLQYRALPQALQALQLFCRKRPWENAADLENAMLWLQPYLPVLQESKSFVAFWQEQEEEKNTLLEAEKKAAESELLGQIDWQLANDEGHTAWQSAQRLQEQNPGHKLFALLDSLEKGLAGQFSDDLPGDAMLLELALLLSLSRGNEALRQSAEHYFAKPEMEPPRSLAGLIAAARIKDSPALYTQAYEQWRGRNKDKLTKPAFLVELIDGFFSRPEQFNAPCWRSPCPGLTDWFDRLHQTAVNASNPIPKETP